MKTLSIHVTTVENNDENICYYDQTSLIVLQAMKAIGLTDNRFVNITDYFNITVDDIKNAIESFIKDENNIVATTVEASPIEFNFGDDVEINDEIISKIQDAFLRDSKIMEECGFEKVEICPSNSSQMINLFIYTNEVGKKIINFINSVEIVDKSEEE